MQEIDAHVVFLVANFINTVTVFAALFLIASRNVTKMIIVRGMLHIVLEILKENAKLQPPQMDAHMDALNITEAMWDH